MERKIASIINGRYIETVIKLGKGKPRLRGAEIGNSIGYSMGRKRGTPSA